MALYRSPNYRYNRSSRSQVSVSVNINDEEDKRNSLNFDVDGKEQNNSIAKFRVSTGMTPNEARRSQVAPLLGKYLR